MKKKTILEIVIGITLILALFAGCGEQPNTGGNQQGGNNATQGSTEPVNSSSLFENLDTTDIEGNKVDASDLSENKLTVINCWATWCNPCKQEIPVLQELAEKYKVSGEVSIKGMLLEINKKTGAIMAGLSDDEKELGQNILDNAGATYQQLLVSESMTEELSQIDGFPTTYFVDKDGKMVGDPVLGAMDKENWEKVIEERLAMVDNG